MATPVRIYLTKGKIALVDEADFHRVAGFEWSASEGKNGVWYALMRREGKPILMHRLLACAGLHQLVDHKDGDGLNNVQENLRLCSYSENAWNAARRRDNTSGFKGVFLDKRRKTWNCAVAAHGVRRTLSGYAFPEAAAEAAEQLRSELHREFACNGRTE